MVKCQECGNEIVMVENSVPIVDTVLRIIHPIKRSTAATADLKWMMMPSSVRNVVHQPHRR